MRIRGIIFRLLCAATLTLAAAQQQVEFPLDYYSFAEIAERMSVDGRRVECARDLSQRLALIHLKPRSWQQVRELLEKGLDVRLRKISDAENRWILERDPETVRLERQRRERLAAYLDKEISKDLRMMQILLDKSIPPEKALKMVAELSSGNQPSEVELQRALPFVKMVREMPFEAALRSWRSHKRLAQLLAQRPDENTPPPALTEQMLATFGFSAAELQWAEEVAVGNEEKWQLLLDGRPLPSDNPVLRKAEVLRTLGMFVDGYISVYLADTLFRQLQPPIRAQEAIQQGITARTYDLAAPPELAAWLLNDSDGTKIPLNANEPVPVRILASATLDQHSFGSTYSITYQLLDTPLLERHAMRVTARSESLPNQSAPLPLSPQSAQKTFQRFDPELAQAYQAAYERHQQLLKDPAVRAPIQNPPGTAAVPFYEWARTQQAEIIVEVLPTPIFMEGSSKTLAEWLETSRELYLLERHDTVWGLRHWEAFLKRVPDLPYAAIRNLFRTEGDYNAWREFYRTTTPEQARWLLVLGFNYSLPLKLVNSKWEFQSGDNLGSAWLTMAILEQLPPQQRNQLWEHDGTEPLSIPLTTLPPNARVELARLLELWRDSLSRTLFRELLFLEEPATVLERLALERRDPRWCLILLPTPNDSGDSIPTTLLYWFEVRERSVMPEIVDPPDFIDP